jgi:hypothetical protein
MPQAVLWIDRTDLADDEPSRVLAYLEGDVRIVPDSNRPQVYQNSRRLLSPTPNPSCDRQCRLKTQSTSPWPRRPSSTEPPYDAATPAAKTSFAANSADNHERARSSSSREATSTSSFDWTKDPVTNQMVGVIDSGMNMIVRGLSDADLGDVDLHGYDLGDAIDVSADRLVIWTPNLFEMDERGESFQAENMPLEIYMEGNVVFRQGESISMPTACTTT